MMKPTNILRLPGSPSGRCSVCDEETKLFGRDRTTGMTTCPDCLAPLAFADRVLTDIGPKIGICHPTPAVP